MTHSLTALSPLDGRYRDDVADLERYFSEAALFRYRVRIEVEYLIFLTRARGLSFVEPLEAQAAAELRGLYRAFGEQEAAAVAAWDRQVNHDVKAVEYWLREQLDRLGLSAWKEAVHFALTSEDVNNLAYAMIVREARDLTLVPALGELLHTLHALALEEADTPMLARTHGQPATPTTLGKEVAVFVSRLKRAQSALADIKLTGKFNGATGTFAAHQAALPDVDWLAFSRGFVRFLDLEPTLLTTQIEPHDSLAETCDAIKRINSILIDLCQDVWQYISLGYLAQAAKSGEVGSSTMPHKVKLPVSRMQRDLTDSTVLRNLGVAFGHSLLAYRRILKGLGKITPNHERLRDDLQAHPEVLAEAIQTILRRENYPEPYEVMKQLTRGHTPTPAELHAFIDTLAVTDAVKAELRALTPEGYTGLAGKLARTIIKR
jgi:adenylosuccinate lyase